jgi:hypothetical protein
MRRNEMPELDLTPAHTVKVLSGLAKHCHKTAEEFAATGDCNKVEFYYKKHHFFMVELYVAEFLTQMKEEIDNA